MSVMTLAALVGHFETSDAALYMPTDTKMLIVRALCREYTKGMSTRIRRVVVRSAVLSLTRQHLDDYADVCRSTLTDDDS
jgi:hypothetical protein